jgi:hypothetical protein
MEKTLFTESELKNRIAEIYEEERLKIINEKWNKLSGKDRTFVLEFLKAVYPEKAMLVTEARWYNTLGDIVGIFDPTGIVDLINGISYWRQGDKLFAILSWVSVIPYVGDLIAKPVIGLMKMGGGAAKAFKAAALTGDAAKIGRTAKTAGGSIAKMVEKSPSWGDKLMNLLKGSVGKVPGLGGLIKVIEEYVNIFKGASKEMKMSKEITGKLAAKAEKQALTRSEKETLAAELKKQGQFRGFRDYAGAGQSWKAKYISGGMGRLWGNRATRSLMRRTKWYLGLLDFLGVANFVGPDELEQKYADLEAKIDEYNKTEKAQEYAMEEFGDVVEKPQSSGIPTPPASSTASPTGGGMDVISALGSLFSGGGAGSKAIGSLI